MTHPSSQDPLRVDELRTAGDIRTVVVAMADMQDRVLAHKAEGCNYQLAVDVEMATVSGYRHASWSTDVLASEA